MKADACANAVFDKDAKRFWHEIYKLSNVKATTNVSTIAGKVGDRQIADMWKQYDEQLYSAKYDNVTMSVFLDKLTSLHGVNHCTGLFSVGDVQTAILQQKSGKSVGPDQRY